MKLGQWLKPVSAEAPCGPELEYDEEFLALQESLRIQHGQEFRRDDGTVIVAEVADIRWLDVSERAQALLSRSKDLRVAILLTRALLHVEGYAGIAAGIALILRLLQDYWEGLHPRLEADDGDPIMRLNALAALNARESVLGDLRSSFLIDSSRHGRLRVRDIEVFQGRLTPRPGESKLTQSELQGRLDAASRLSPQLAMQAAAALDDLDELTAWLGAKVGATRLPDLSGLRFMLHSVAVALDRNAGSGPPDCGADSRNPIERLNSCQITHGSPPESAMAHVACRQDVVEMLGMLCEYLERNEPTNPVQHILRRARRMMNMNFLELMRNIAPDGLVQAEKVFGERLIDGDD